MLRRLIARPVSLAPHTASWLRPPKVRAIVPEPSPNQYRTSQGRVFDVPADVPPGQAGNDRGDVPPQGR